MKRKQTLSTAPPGKTGVFVNTYFHKGDGITVEGRMESRKWVDNDGKNRVAWGVTCDNVEFSLGRSKPQETGTAAENSEAQKSSKILSILSRCQMKICLFKGERL